MNCGLASSDQRFGKTFLYRHSCCSGIKCTEMVCSAILGFRTNLDKVPSFVAVFCVEEDQNGFSDL